jgi:hypothetical protein
MTRSFETGLVVMLALLDGAGSALRGQNTDSAAARRRSAPPPAVFSIGQPPIWRQQLSAQGTAYSQSGHYGGTLSYGVYHAFNKPPIAAFNPLLGVIGGTVEGYGSVGGIEDIGLRAMATSRMLATSVGADWDARHGRINTIISWQSALRRGGILGGGSMVRVDWIPAREQTVRVGLAAPLLQPLAGRTRPRATTVTIPDPPEERAAAPSRRVATRPQAGTRPSRRVAERDIESSSNVIAAYSNLYTDDAIRASRSSSYRAAMDRSRTALETLFAEGLDGTECVRAARRARIAVLDRIIFPVDSVFGRVKDVDVARLSRGATADFDRWLRDSSGIAPAKQPLAASAFAAWLDAVTPAMRAIVERQRDSRLVWLPMDLALTFDQYDDQIEVDSLIGRVVGHPFTDGNALTYMRSTDLPLEVARSILAARQYHVLWTHEFMGRQWYSRAIDNIGYTVTADAYLPALTAAVRRYDSTGVFPLYMLLHDQFFYETSDGRLWLTILEDPLNASMRLKGDDGTRERHLRQRQDELRAAVAGSSRLQQDALASGDGEQWLRNTIKVHVNVGNRSDFSFRSGHIIPGIPFMPDNVMRDHRKLVIYDVNEAEPNRGAVFVMGIGIGELYSSATWEDRGFRLRGPATLEARAGLRQALRANGFSESEIPAPLRAVASKKAQEEKADLGEFVGRSASGSQPGRLRRQEIVRRACDVVQPDTAGRGDHRAGSALDERDVGRNARRSRGARGARSDHRAGAGERADSRRTGDGARARRAHAPARAARQPHHDDSGERWRSPHRSLRRTGDGRRRSRSHPRGARRTEAVSVDPSGDSVRRQDACRARSCGARDLEQARRDGDCQGREGASAATASEDTGHRACRCHRGPAAPTRMGRHPGRCDARAVEPDGDLRGQLGPRNPPSTPRRRGAPMK